MTVIALASVKGSPGVTTAATAIAASWPPRRSVLLVEADPFGGDLAPRYGSNVSGGLTSLFTAARRSLTPDAVWEHVDRLPGGLPVLFGLTHVDQAVANQKLWPTIAQALAQLDADVIVDAGRLLPGFSGGVRDVLDRVHTLMVLCEPTLEAIVHLRAALPGLVGVLQGRRLLVVPTSAVGYPARDMAKTLQVEVGPPMPDDPAAAAALANKRRVRKLQRTRLLRWAVAMVAELDIEEPSAPVVTDLVPGSEVHRPTLTDEPHSREGPTQVPEPVRAGSKWDAHR